LRETNSLGKRHTGNTEGTPPTGREDCDELGHHGGIDSTRVYTVDGVKICEICGLRDMKEKVQNA
jgi:hypothetical protein